MILRGIHVENWRCIRELDLTDLPEGIVVLHGPNRTGKSSLALALRACLFDSDHDTSGKEIKSSIPWNGTGPPKVVVEFETYGATYRLTKIFSKKKEGTACLDKKVGPTWQVMEAAPKEASRRVRELLGADKSTAGLNQLLWLTQGEIGLPEQKNLDKSLQQKLVNVLGVMVTGRDFTFKADLDKRCARWFTELGRSKGTSQISNWEKQHADRLKARDEELKKLQKWEEAIGRLDRCVDDLPARKRDVQRAENEVERLRQEREQSKERLRRHADARNALETATLLRSQADERLAKYRDAQQRSREEDAKVVVAKNAEDAAQEAKANLAQRHQEMARHLADALQAEEKHHKGRDEIDDCRKLLTIAERQAQLQQTLEAATNQEKEIAELENNLRNVLAPDEKTLKSLRDNRRQADNLRAQLDAAALNLTVISGRPLRMQLRLDAQTVRPVELESGSKHVWSWRQRAHIAVFDVGVIELARAQEDLDLDRAACDLADRDRDYAEAVCNFQEDPADEGCLDRLAERRMQRDTHAKRLKDVRAELARTAPEGRGSLEADALALVNQRQTIIERRPDLAGWQPAAGEIDEREKQFKKQGAELEIQRKKCDTFAKQASEQLEHANIDLQKLKEDLAGASASALANRAQLERLGEESVLLEAVKVAQETLAKSQQALADNQLTESERTVGQRLAEAESAMEGRQKRLRELEDQLLEVRTFLQGNEGLHMHVADAEAALQEAESALAREKLEAQAHKRLRDLFEECRENQVQQVMGPIAGRVLEWSRKIGLHDYHEVRFGDQFMPEGIIMAAGDPAQPILIGDESYGTEEQLSLLVRLALGGILAQEEPVVAILDDPLAHADIAKHRNILNVLRIASEGGPTWTPPAGRLQILILTCHPDRFDHLPGARHIDLERVIKR